MKVDSFASLEHYQAHLAPIAAELARRGRFGVAYAARASQPWGVGLPPRRRGYGEPERLTMVAGYADAMRRAGLPLIYVEHGAAQSYPGDPRSATHGSYAGGKGLEDVVLFLSPREEVAEKWRAAYPLAQAVAVGCPRLDSWHQAEGLGERPSHPPTVAFSFHWQCALVPETTSAWPHYDKALPDVIAALRAEGWRVLGHGHPRLWGMIERRWRELGVERVEHLDDVFAQADVYVVDNSSSAYEAASIGIPVVMLNCPAYRRDVHHGLRFWSSVPGEQVDEPSEVVDAILRAAADPPHLAEHRRRVVSEVYAGGMDGKASERAADAIEALFTEGA